MKPAGSDIGAIEHVVFLMLENRSFDHFFGSLRGVRGFDDHPQNSDGVFAQAWPSGRDPTLLPFRLDTTNSPAECTFDLSHTWPAQHECWNGGAMDSFVSTHTSNTFEGPNNGPLTMGYFTREDLPFSYALADTFTVCDNYFCSVLGPTHPNRLFALSGTNDPDGVAGGPVLITNSSNSAKFSASWETMPERLSANGVSWKTYQPKGTAYLPASTEAMLISDNILLYFNQYSNPGSDLFQRAFGSTFPQDFQSDINHNRLPAVSWIVPPIGYDEHPPAPPARGEWFVHQALRALTSHRRVWQKTVLFVTYDENDGFFDHVAPPTAPPATPGEYLTVNPLPSAAGGIAGPIGLGFRVPMLVISPFSRGGFVSSDTFDHTSQLRFLETRFGVPAPNISAWRRGVTGDLTSSLQPSPNVKRLPALPSTPKTDPRILTECLPAQLVELNPQRAPYPVPNPQQMPSQEPGTRPQA